MIVRTQIDPDSAIASVTFPVDQLDKGECSVARTIRVEVGESEILIDINYKGQLLGMEILDINTLCSPTMLKALLEGP
jgi:uncharacterized protein YuzE